MVVLDAFHPDIFEFIEAKAHEEDHGRPLLAAGYPLAEVISSLAFQHANHSVRIPMSSCVGPSAGASGRCGRSPAARWSRGFPLAGFCVPARPRPRTAATRSCSSKTRSPAGTLAKIALDDRDRERVEIGGVARACLSLREFVLDRPQHPAADLAGRGVRLGRQPPLAR
ncbi:MAG: hypothetical protein ACXVSL_19880, partial [Solirubrobacteraceae bacterium]